MQEHGDVNGQLVCPVGLPPPPQSPENNTSQTQSGDLETEIMPCSLEFQENKVKDNDKVIGAEGGITLPAGLERHLSSLSSHQEGTAQNSSLPSDHSVTSLDDWPQASTFSVHSDRAAEVLGQVRNLGLHANIVPRSHVVKHENTNGALGVHRRNHWLLVIGTDAEAVDYLLELHRLEGQEPGSRRQEDDHCCVGWFGFVIAGAVGGLTMYFAF